MPTDYTYGIPSREYLEKGDTYTGSFSGNKYIYTGEAWDIVEANMNEPKMAKEKTHVDRTKFIPGVAEELRLTLVSKNGDYAPAGEFSNFEISAEFAGIQPFELILAQIGIKMTRINNLHHNDYGPNNESLRDSLLDLAGYGIIAAAWLDAVQASQLED